MRSDRTVKIPSTPHLSALRSLWFAGTSSAIRCMSAGGAAALLLLAPVTLQAQCTGTLEGTSGNPIPLVIGTEADCATNRVAVPSPTTQHQSNVTPLGCGGQQQRDIWFSFTANTTETVINLHENNLASMGFMVYRGPCGAVMDLVGCAGYTGVIAGFRVIRGAFQTVPGDTYYVRVSRMNSNSLNANLRICGWSTMPLTDHPACDASFESGTTAGWTCRYGNHTNAGVAFPNLGCLNPNGMGAPLLNGNGGGGAWNAGDRHTIMSDKSFRDPRTFGEVGAVAPRGGNFSFRLGYNMTGTGNPGGKASSLSYDLPVTVQNAGFTFMFASVMRNPNHALNQQPRFEAMVIDPDGTILDCGYHLFVSGSPLVPFLRGPGDWLYTRWTEVALDLTSFIGRTVTIEFRAVNCSPAAHPSYAYIDAYCRPLGEVEQMEFCAGASSIQICAPSGYANYSWPPGQPGLQPPFDQRCVTVNNPVEGTIYTVNMELITGCPTRTTVELLGIPVVISGDTTVCAGADVDLRVRVDGGLYPPYTFQWSHGPSGPGPHRVNPTMTTVYTVTTTNGDGCTSVRNVTVTVDECVHTVTTSGGATCTGGCVTVAAQHVPNPAGDFPPYTYTWSDGLPNGPGPHQVCPAATTTYTVTVTDGNGATATATVTATVHQLPEVGATSTDVRCFAGSDGSATAHPADTTSANTFSWNSSPPATGLTVSGLPTGTWTVTMTDANGCTGTATATVGEPPELLPVVNGTPADCGATNGTATVTPSGGTGPYAVSWNTVPPRDSLTITGLAGGIYDATVTDANGCTALRSILVEAHPGPAADFHFAEVCDGSPVTFTNTSSGLTPPTPHWDLGDGTTSSQTNPTHTYPGAGTYTVTLTVTSASGCTAERIRDITIHPIPLADFGADPSEGCAPLSTRFTMDTPLSGGSCLWEFGDGQRSTDCAGPTHTYAYAGCYTVSLTVTSSAGCVDRRVRDSLICVTALPLAGFDISPELVPDSWPFVDFRNTSAGATRYYWEFFNGDSTSVSRDPSLNLRGVAPGRYTACLWAWNDYGCVDSLCKVFRITTDMQVHVPNAFTPDGDGTNDVFIPIITGHSQEDYQFMVFNRWGERVFETNNPTIGWNGSCKGVLSPDGVYVWRLTAKPEEGTTAREYIGHVTLLR